MEFRCPMHPSIMTKKWLVLLVLIILLFSQCKNGEKAMVVPTNDRLHAINQEVVMPSFFTEIAVSDIYFKKDTLRKDILPKTLEQDTSDLRQSIQKHFKYSEMCQEMLYQGKVYFEISKDSIGNFANTKVLRGLDGIDGSCTMLVLKELHRILKIAPIIEVNEEIESFIMAIQILIWKD